MAQETTERITLDELKRAVSVTYDEQQRSLKRQDEIQDDLVSPRFALGATGMSLGWSGFAAATQGWTGVGMALGAVGMFLGALLTYLGAWFLVLLFLFRNKPLGYREQGAWVVALVSMTLIWLFFLPSAWVVGVMGAVGVAGGGALSLRGKRSTTGESTTQQDKRRVLGFSEATCDVVRALPDHLPDSIERCLNEALADYADLRLLLEDERKERPDSAAMELLTTAEWTLNKMLQRGPMVAKLLKLAELRKDDLDSKNAAEVAVEQLERFAERLHESVAAVSRYTVSKAASDAVELRDQAEYLKLLAEAEEEVESVLS